MQEFRYIIVPLGFRELENWDGKIEGLEVSFQREIEWCSPLYELYLEKELDTDPDKFKHSFCTENMICKDNIVVEPYMEHVLFDEEFPGLIVRPKTGRLDAPFDFYGETIIPFFQDGRALEPNLSHDLPEKVRTKLLKACKCPCWSCLEELGLDAEGNGVDRSMDGFVIFKTPSEEAAYP